MIHSIREIMKGGTAKYLSWVSFQILQKANVHANKYKASELGKIISS